MERKPVVLVVAENGSGLEILKRLKKAFEVRGPMGAIEGLRVCSEEIPSAAAIQVELPDISGSELCRLIRGRKRTERLPLVLFSARSDGYTPSADHLASADSYLSRSEVHELVPRLRALIGELTPGGDRGTSLVREYEGRHLKANFDRVHITVDGARVTLSRRELRLLQFLVTHTNHVLSRHDILVNVWKGENDGRSRTIDTHIRRLRMKLGPAGAQIRTEVKIGYCFDDGSDPPSAYP